MRKFLFLFLLIASSLVAEVVELNLGSRGRLTLYFPDSWKATPTELGGQVTLNVSPEDEDVNASFTLTVTFPESDQFRQKSRLKMQVEGKNEAKEFYLSTGFGYYCSYIDPALRGKPPIKGDYKVVSFGKIRLAPDVLVDVQILADSFTDQPYQSLLGAVEGLEYKR
jgi:hypothetical protein